MKDNMIIVFLMTKQVWFISLFIYFLIKTKGKRNVVYEVVNYTNYDTVNKGIHIEIIKNIDQ